jgi:hypothetical protein
MRNRTWQLRKSGLAPSANFNDLLPPRRESLGQSYPQQCPQEEDAQPFAPREPLGAPLSIREVAELIGCSPWTVRQRYLLAGLPHLRLGPNGKLIFYKNQIIRWLLLQQKKGGRQ